MSRLIATLMAASIGAAAYAEEATIGPGAIIRLLDKTSGQLEDVEMFSGQIARLGSLDIRLNECRYPTGNPSGDAFALLQIKDRGDDQTVFEGWMIASSPALNALDHPRYDVWVLRCKTS